MPHVFNKGVSIHYRVEGDGPPLVLVHGFSDSSDVWYERGYVAALKPKYRLVLIDARGHGRSDKPHDPQSYTSEKYAYDVVAILDDLGMKTAAYWGYSMGGRIGFALARHALDRVACLVIGGRSASAASAYPPEPGKEPPLITALRAGPDAIMKVWGSEWMIPSLRERLLANDMAALIACQQQGPVHDPARKSASEIRGADFVSLPDLNHPAALCRSDLVLPHVEPFLAKATGR
jgi:pimeloyl-ACP methyl ester carboxylesterase